MPEPKSGARGCFVALQQLHMALRAGEGDCYSPTVPELYLDSQPHGYAPRTSSSSLHSVFVCLNHESSMVVFAHNPCTSWTLEKSFHELIHQRRAKRVHITLQGVPGARGAQSATALITLPWNKKAREGCTEINDLRWLQPFTRET